MAYICMQQQGAGNSSCNPFQEGCPGSLQNACVVCSVAPAFAGAPSINCGLAATVTQLTPEGPYDHDVYGDLAPFAVGPEYVVRYQTGAIRLLATEPIISISCAHLPGSVDFLCHYRVERNGEGWRVRCREFDVDTGELSDPLVFVTVDQPHRRTALLQLEYGYGGNIPDGTDGAPCALTWNGRCFTKGTHELTNFVWDPYYWPDDCDGGNSGWNRIGIDLDAGIDTGGGSDAVLADKSAAWRSVYDKVLQTINGMAFIVEHRGRENSAPESSLIDLWDWQHYPDTPNMAAVAPAQLVRFIGMSTGIVVEADWVIREASVVVRLGVCEVDRGLSIDVRVLAEIHVGARMGIRRRNAGPSGTFRSHGEDVVLDFGSDLLNTDATIILPNGVACSERLIGQVWDVATQRWIGLPRYVRWSGLSGPGPWANPEWQQRPLSCSYFSGPCAVCCSAMDAVNGLVIPFEPTDTDSPLHEQEYTGDVVLSFPSGVLAGPGNCRETSGTGCT